MTAPRWTRRASLAWVAGGPCCGVRRCMGDAAVRSRGFRLLLDRCDRRSSPPRSSIFAFSRGLKCSSVYDAYWSVAPIVIVFYWVFQVEEAINPVRAGAVSVSRDLVGRAPHLQLGAQLAGAPSHRLALPHHEREGAISVVLLGASSAFICSRPWKCCSVSAARGLRSPKAPARFPGSIWSRSIVTAGAITIETVADRAAAGVHQGQATRRDHQDGALGLLAASKLLRRAFVLVGPLRVRARGRPELRLDDCGTAHDDGDVRGRVDPLDGST